MVHLLLFMLYYNVICVGNNRYFRCPAGEVIHKVMNETSGTCVKRCFRVMMVDAGMMVVIDQNSGNINTINCPDDKYQPGPYISNTQCGCERQKSTCNGVGQVVASNGNTTTDRTCRCDNTEGFTYSKFPRYIHGCMPKTENCSCEIKACDSGDILSSDYNCSKEQFISNSKENLTERHLTGEVTPGSQQKQRVEMYSTLAYIGVFIGGAMFGACALGGILYCLWKTHKLDKILDLKRGDVETNESKENDTRLAEKKNAPKPKDVMSVRANDTDNEAEYKFPKVSGVKSEDKIKDRSIQKLLLPRNRDKLSKETRSSKSSF